MSDKSKRVREFQKDELQEKYNQKLNAKLAEMEDEFLQELEGEPHPPIFVVGCQRSGTTLLNQLIINNFKVAYPTNFVARFWNAPTLGCLLQSNMKLEFGNVPYKSNLGYTPGSSGPHEFNYFWRKWFVKEPYKQNGTNYLSESEKRAFKLEMEGMSKFTGCSWVFKNLHRVPFEIKLLSELFPKALFVYIKRDIYANVESTLNARKKLFGDEKEWLGAKPYNYQKIVTLKPLEAVTKQIKGINYTIENQLKEVNPENVLRLNYQFLTDNPQSLLLNLNSYDLLKRDDTISSSFNVEGILRKKTKSLNKEFCAQIDSVLKDL